MDDINIAALSRYKPYVLSSLSCLSPRWSYFGNDSDNVFEPSHCLTGIYFLTYELPLPVSIEMSSYAWIRTTATCRQRFVLRVPLRTSYSPRLRWAELHATFWSLISDWTTTLCKSKYIFAFVFPIGVNAMHIYNSQLYIWKCRDIYLNETKCRDTVFVIVVTH